MVVFVARTRIPAQRIGMVLLFVGLAVGWLDNITPLASWLAETSTGLIVGGFLPLIFAIATTFVAPVDKREPRMFTSPVRGKWQAVNSPTSKVPSHGTHAYAQSYAVDLLALPEDRPHPEFGKTGRSFLAPGAFPAFGEPLFAPARGVVVAAHDGQKDHRSRSSWVALALFFIESIPREAVGLRGVLGNHVVIRIDDGTHFLMAHLRHRSIRGSVGYRIAEGDQLAECGNTGNSTEPHLHAQLMDGANASIAVSLPWGIRGAGATSEGDGLPADEGTFIGR